VLVDTILQHSDLTRFREVVQQHSFADAAAGLQDDADSSELGQQQQPLNDLQQQQQQQQHDAVLQDACCDAAPYVTKLLHSIQHTTVQQVLSWQAEDWHVFFSSTAAALSLKLQMLGSDAAGSQQQQHEAAAAAAAPAAAAPHMDVVQQQFCQVLLHGRECGGAQSNTPWNRHTLRILVSTLCLSHSLG
jgi:hypothetical protein